MDTEQPQIRIESGTERDIPVILGLIRGLAEYEKLSAEVTATEEGLRESLFGRNPSAEVLIAYAGLEPVGFAVFFQSYSTFLGRPGLYLEDLFVLPPVEKARIWSAAIGAGGNGSCRAWMWAPGVVGAQLESSCCGILPEPWCAGHGSMDRLPSDG